MKRRYLIIGGLVILVAIGGILAKQRASGQLASMILVEPTVEDLEIRIRSTGTVQSLNRLEAKPPTAGRIEEILVAEGASVEKGQILAWMSSSERVSLLDAARSDGKAEVKRWQKIYRPTPIISPMTGTLILSNVKPGQTVMNSEVVFVISDRLIVQAVVDETDIAKIGDGQVATISLDAYPSIPVEGKVTRIAFDARTVNNVTTYQVDVLPISTPAFMKSGMTANVSFLVDRRAEVLTLPVEAVNKGSEGAFVLLAKAGGGRRSEIKQLVKTGLSDGKRIEIAEGVTENDRVVVQEFNLGPETAAGVNPFMPSFGKRGDKKGAANGPRK
jgi:macrolide-specific efflux system membrane fusion protein